MWDTVVQTQLIYKNNAFMPETKFPFISSGSDPMKLIVYSEEIITWFWIHCDIKHFFQSFF